MPDTDNSILGYFPEAELVLAVVYPLGTEKEGLEAVLRRHLTKFGYGTNPIRLTRVFPDLFKLSSFQWKLSGIDVDPVRLTPCCLCGGFVPTGSYRYCLSL